MNWEVVFFIISCLSLIHELVEIKNKRFSFIIRYFLIVVLFWDLEIFKDPFLNFFICEMISIGFAIYLLSYFVVGIFMIFIPKFGSKFWKIIYFIVYVFITIIIYCISLALNNIGLLPLI